MIEYVVVNADHIHTLVLKVQAYLDEGWELQGGISYSISEFNKYIQAVARYKN